MLPVGCDKNGLPLFLYNSRGSFQVEFSGFRQGSAALEQASESGSIHRRAVEVSLPQSTSEVNEGVTNFWSLNSFGHHICVQRPGQSQDRPDYFSAGRL